jgi:predicted RNA-binding protein with PUA-like domain
MAQAPDGQAHGTRLPDPRYHPRMGQWLIKSEPGSFSFDDLLAADNQTTVWDGVRNYQARNFMRDGMKPGDKVLYYHSSTSEPGVVGVAEVASDPYPDPSQFDRRSRYFDPKSSPEQPRWFVVDVRAVSPLARTVTLSELKDDPSLAGLRLVQRGNRLSVMPVSGAEFRRIVSLADQPPPG